MQEVKLARTPRPTDGITCQSFPSPSSKLFTCRETFISLYFAVQNLRLQIRFSRSAQYIARLEEAHSLPISDSYAFATNMAMLQIHYSHFLS